MSRRCLPTRASRRWYLIEISVLMEGSIGAFPRRVVVADDAWDRARRVLKEAGLGEWVADHEQQLRPNSAPGKGRARTFSSAALLTIRQPRNGYRAGTDAVLLAALIGSGNRRQGRFSTPVQGSASSDFASPRVSQGERCARRARTASGRARPPQRRRQWLWDPRFG